MFTSFFTWLAGPFFGGFKAVWKLMWDAGYVTITWVVATIVGVMVITEQVTSFMLTAFTTMAEFAGLMSGALTGTSNASAVSNTFATINVFFPLSEAFTLLSALMLTTIAAMSYRLIKSWIPTVA